MAAHSNAIHILKSSGKEMVNQQNIASDKIRVRITANPNENNFVEGFKLSDDPTFS